MKYQKSDFSQKTSFCSFRQWTQHRPAIDNLTATLLLSFQRVDVCPSRDTNAAVWCVCTETTNLS